MSLVPLFNDYDAFADMEQLLESPFGLGIHPMDIFRPRRSLVMQPRNRCSPYIRYYRPRRETQTQKSELVSTIGKDGFQVCMDVSQFTPNELVVKTVDGTVVIEGKHEEREDDHGMIQRHFIRKYTLPKGFDPKDVVSTISSDGVLTVKAPSPPNEAIQNERIVQIQQTGPAHLNVKQPAQAETIKPDQKGADKTKKPVK